MSDMARHLAERGAMVAGIDLAQFQENLDADGADCVFPDGDLENLSHFLQAYYHVPAYLPPILAGYSAGGTLAYAVLAQAPANTFAAAVSMDFCPSSPLRKHLCKGSGVDYRARAGDAGVDFLPSPTGNPWLVLETPAPKACDAAVVSSFVAEVPNAQIVAIDAGVGAPAPAYLATFETLIAKNAPPAAQAAPAALSDLPLIDLPPQAASPQANTFAIMISGDGGWAGLDKDVAAALNAEGIPVVGLDSLRYFWSARTPGGLAADLDRMIRYYTAALGKPHVMLIGYSQGADVLPFAVNRLSNPTRAHVTLAAIMGMSEHALFEFHMSSWVSDDESGPATLPEVDRITDIPVLCIYGDEESDSLCPKLDAHKFTVVKLKGGHHFDGNYDGLARTILGSARQ